MTLLFQSVRLCLLSSSLHCALTCGETKHSNILQIQTATSHRTRVEGPHESQYYFSSGVTSGAVMHRIHP
uniref:Putative secreted protein n=1 Tax=Ixodes ricinus TaxID=34613 RepID=A0A6B0TTN7_IXORI